MRWSGRWESNPHALWDKRLSRPASLEESRVVIGQAEIWWAVLGEPTGSAPGYRRPIVVVQCDALNRSRIGTVVCVPLISNLKWSHVPISKLPEEVRLSGAAGF
jgi:mRNA-degrading endonuclease toxin of MazEF toxin-antitoxin module